jgi:hypothetical protein
LAVTLAGAVPVMVGARFGGAVTLIEKACSDVLSDPSETVMTMLL